MNNCLYGKILVAVEFLSTLHGLGNVTQHWNLVMSNQDNRIKRTSTKLRFIVSWCCTQTVFFSHLYIKSWFMPLNLKYAHQISHLQHNWRYQHWDGIRTQKKNNPPQTGKLYLFNGTFLINFDRRNLYVWHNFVVKITECLLNYRHRQ